MQKDEAVDIAYNADNMTLEELLQAYAQFQVIVNNTPEWFCNCQKDLPAKDMKFQSGLHAAMGLVTEAGEILDAYKKELYGKMRPLRQDNIKEEAGDSFYYLHALCAAYGFDLKDIIKDNVVKLANRYIEKFDV